MEEIKAVIAVQACRLILHLQRGDPPGEPFPHVHTILVYPGSFRGVREMRHADGRVEVDASWNQGEAWQDGKVLLAWDSAYQGGRRADDGRNLVIHEFAHQLDLIDGEADGLPPVEARASRERWKGIVSEGFARLQSEVQAGRTTVLDAYGATHPAEFFAVASEHFFETSRELRCVHPELHAALVGFYQYDPQQTP